MIDRRTTLVQIATSVAEVLRSASIESVLVGGSAITAHEPSIYVSQDADFVAAAANAELAPPMESLGFQKRAMHWAHPSTDFSIQFVSGYAAVGSRRITDFFDMKTKRGRLRTLKIEDAVTDRLIKFIVWNDAEALNVALRVLEKRGRKRSHRNDREESGRRGSNAGPCGKARLRSQSDSAALYLTFATLFDGSL